MSKKQKQKHESLKEYSEKAILQEGEIHLTNPMLEVSIGKGTDLDDILVSRNGKIIGGITEIIINLSEKEQSVTVKGISDSAFLDKATARGEDE